MTISLSFSKGIVKACLTLKERIWGEIQHRDRREGLARLKRRWQVSGPTSPLEEEKYYLCFQSREKASLGACTSAFPDEGCEIPL